ncbi:sucrose-6-phosphate hydrolase [Clostridium botulinum]|uniref:Sucrose-6-phosphate hydrolase n=1 Tax=Clostridium botulinum TaxID=1491 RepID=A0A6B4JR01_CLOBO|nr:sucrose-6-phosphate hydrolase [Clostridium botulinum]EES47725.1 sucrose-6-phosphate hydrolase [Clostridium botulinum E1 str. 'BoNT E Beluga']MBY6762650.1 sucrose-6-phosphate hydrolase [Clostridium botulinum]MBY6921435.1 sucrose-6-phosphate hydrolase [Clostridium botulinum]MCR1132333.1 sucrose-6-phosphate hydrolase [Clostridium botulinum]NFJ59379.1 sucrose-6-phosphate hydrolase [Clostridium botulinum]
MQDKNVYEKIKQDLDQCYKNSNNSNWKNNFHIEMPFGLVNDPNGLSYYNGEFHIFYQWNPFGCEHKNKHWGLVKTSDFINFTKPEIILKPVDWFDKNGCYSGGAYVKDDTLKLFYTGNVKDENNNRESYQCIANYYKDGTFEKKGPVIFKQPEGYTAHFRDPFIFEEDNIYYMVLGVQTEDLKGRTLLYKSLDIEKWTFIGELKTDLDDFGYMWECPNLVKLDNDKKYAFLFSPQGLEAEELKNQNIYQSGYIIGDLDLNNISLNDHSKFKEIDMGFDFYAPQVFKHENQNIIIGWIGMPDKDSEYPSSKEDWMFSLTMPRVLEYKNDVIYQKPLKQLEYLRHSKEIELNNEEVASYNINFDSRSKEIKLNLDIKESENIDIAFNFGEENIKLNYDKKSEVCTINRNNMELGGKGIRKFKLKAKDNLDLHIFIDNSVIEIYYQDGLEVTTLMYFPKEKGLNIEIKDNSKVKINELNVWNLRSVKYE